MHSRIQCKSVCICLYFDPANKHNAFVHQIRFFYAGQAAAQASKPQRRPAAGGGAEGGEGGRVGSARP